MKSGLVFALRGQQMLVDYDLYPRAAYYVLREAHNSDLLLKDLFRYVDITQISLMDAVLRARR
jgi:hypothetical protein